MQVILAQAEGSCKVLCHRPDVANSCRLALVIPFADRNSDELLKNRARVHRLCVSLGAAVTQGRPGTTASRQFNTSDGTAVRGINRGYQPKAARSSNRKLTLLARKEVKFLRIGPNK